MNNISFTIDTTEVIPEILNKYGLEDGNEKMLEKLEKGETVIVTGPVILDLAIKVANGELSAKDMPAILEKQLQLPRATADLLAKDIQEKIVSNAKKIIQAETKQPQEAVIPQNIEGNANLFPKIEPSTKIAELIIKNPIAIEKNPKGKVASQTKEQERVKKPIISEEIKKFSPQPRQQKGSDTYREPIE